MTYHFFSVDSSIVSETVCVLLLIRSIPLQAYDPAIEPEERPVDDYTKEDGERDRESDDHQRQPDGLLPRRPRYLPQLGARILVRAVQVNAGRPWGNTTPGANSTHLSG